MHGPTLELARSFRLVLPKRTESHSDTTRHIHSGLYALACRMNHACKPNARYVWRPDLKRELVFATRPIRAGDEITVTYLAEYAPQAARKLRLLEEFRFECKCSACEDPARDLNAQEQSDARMLEMQELIDNVPTVGYTRVYRPAACSSDVRAGATATG